MLNMEAIMADLVLTNQGTGETDSELASNVKGVEIVGKYVGGGSKEGRGFEKNDVLSSDERGKVRENVRLNVSGCKWRPSLSVLCLSGVVCKYVYDHSVVFVECRLFDLDESLRESECHVKDDVVVFVVVVVVVVVVDGVDCFANFRGRDIF